MLHVCIRMRSRNGGLMSNLFITLINMSIAAGWLILVVVVLRLLLKKAPRWISCVLWALVGIRLICPFSPESALSLIPSAETLPETSLYAQKPTIHSGVAFLNSTVNPVISESLAPAPGASVNPMQMITYVAAIVWIIGVVGMLLYGTVSVWKIKRGVKVSLPLAHFISRTVESSDVNEEQAKDGFLMRDAVMTGNAVMTDSVAEAAHDVLTKWQEKCRVCDDIASPFILGIIRPMIYLPSDLTPEQMKQVLAHETAHLRRKDHWWKPLGFAILTLHWFNPLVWLAYVLLCRDIELACDEKVVRTMEGEEKRNYSKALLDYSVSRRMISACPLAFGEVGVKTRIRSVLNYKKPAFWIIVIALLACIAVAVCFLTNPLGTNDETPKEEHFGSLTPETIEIGSLPGRDTLVGIDIPVTKSVYRTYRFADSVDFVQPAITLNVHSNMFSFSYSAFSSYWPTGTYEIKGDELILSTSDGQFTYVFDIEEEGYAFNEKKSSVIPKYRYSADGEAESPVPDGALFRYSEDGGEYRTEEGQIYHYTDGFYSGIGGVHGPEYASVRGDFDNDGKEERYSLGYGPTSGLYTVRFTVYEEGERTHFSIFHVPYRSLKFAFRENGELYIACEEWKFIDGEDTFIKEHQFEIGFEEDWVVLEENGVRMEHWGEPGLNSRWLKPGATE